MDHIFPKKQKLCDGPHLSSYTEINTQHRCRIRAQNVYEKLTLRTVSRKCLVLDFSGIVHPALGAANHHMSVHFLKTQTCFT